MKQAAAWAAGSVAAILFAVIGTHTVNVILRDPQQFQPEVTYTLHNQPQYWAGQLHTSYEDCRKEALAYTFDMFSLTSDYLAVEWSCLVIRGNGIVTRIKE